MKNVLKKLIASETFRAAASRTPPTFDTARVEMMAMIAMTIRSSMSVNALFIFLSFLSLRFPFVFLNACRQLKVLCFFNHVEHVDHVDFLPVLPVLHG